MRRVCRRSVWSGANAKKTVLVVDDEPELRGLISDLLRDDGYDVQAACDGIEALRILGTLCTDECVVVSDLQMPRMSGRQLLREIRKDLRLLGLRVLIVSSAAERDELREADGILAKPFDARQLSSMVADLFAA
jgi:two-component system chemotaxis response regulator CheY